MQFNIFIKFFFIFNILFCNSYKIYSMELRKNYQSINNLKNIHFSKIEKIALFTYNTGEVDIITNNISSYYKKIYNNSNNTTIAKIIN